MACEQEIERAIYAEGQVLLGWRDVPTNNAGLSKRTKEVEPVIRQVFVARGSRDMDQDALERKLYVIRKGAGHAIQALNLRHGKEFYVPSFSTRTIVYKGMLLAHQVGEYYIDLHDATMVSALAMVHQRFSTNTFPTWDLAHPFRFICHNGEINTLRGNFNWIRAREGAIASKVLGDDLSEAVAADLRRPVGFRVVRQRARAARHGRLLAVARDDADDSRSVGGQSADGRGPARVLRIPRGADGAVGRTGGDGVHQRPPDRRDARSQRIASGALHRHRRRLHRDGVGSGRARHSGVEDRQEVAAAAGQDAARRSRRGPHRRRRRAEAHARHGEAVSRVGARCRLRLEEMPEPAPPTPSDGAAARSPAGVRLHAGRSEDHPRADGEERRGADRLDGQRRGAAGAVRPAEGVLQLLQAAVRAGHESADRSDPRRARDVARFVHRSAPEPARSIDDNGDDANGIATSRRCASKCSSRS